MDGLKANRWLAEGTARGREYDHHFAQLAATGMDMHGEAAFVESFGCRSVLDAGCGTGRVAIELHRRGLEVVGVDLDPAMLEAARAKAPELLWLQGDLSEIEIEVEGDTDGTIERRLFDAVVMAGNVMIFLTEGTEGEVLANMARHLPAGGLLIAGFQLRSGRLTLDTYDRCASEVGFTLFERWSTWDRAAFEPGDDYVVSVHGLDTPAEGHSSPHSVATHG